MPTGVEAQRTTISHMHGCLMPNRLILHRSPVSMTSRHAASAALAQLQQAHAKIIGAVLNRVEVTRNPYYYAQYYRREYAQYYAKTS